MKEFLLLIKGNEMHIIPEEEKQRRLSEYRAWMMKMLDEKRYVGGQSLEPVGYHIKDKNTVITDGPYIEPKELIGGFVIIRAQSMDEAADIALSCPLLNYYEIYVRPLVPTM